MPYDIMRDAPILVLKGFVDFADTSPVTVFEIPAGVLVTHAMVEIKTAFAGTSPTVKFGDEDTEEGFVPEAGVTEGTIGWYPGDGEVTSMGSYLYDATKKSTYKFYPAVKDAKVAIGGTDLTTGVAAVYLVCIDLRGKMTEQGES